MTYIQSPSSLIGIGCFLLICVVIRATRLDRLSPAASERLASVDGLRGVLAFSVFVHHFFAAYQWKHTGVWDRPASHVYGVVGGFSVVLFFMITGFLFFGKIKSSQGRIDFNAFFLGRVFRLVPVYAVSTVAVCSIVFIQQHAPRLMLFQPALDQLFLFQLTVIDADPTSPIINAGVTWSLGYEWLFYLLLPVICIGWRLLSLETWVIFVLSIAALWIAKSETVPPYAVFGLGAFAPFLLGGLVREIGRSDLVRQHGSGPWGTVVAVAAGLVAFKTCQTAYSVSAYVLLAVFFAPIAYGNSMLGLLTTRTVTFLGEISYDVYLLHGIALFSLFTLLMPDALGHASTPGRLFALIMIAGGCTIILSTLVHLCVERPMLAVGRQLVRIDRSQELAAP